MATETEFVNGLIVKAPRDGAPDYVKASISIKREELIAWLQTRQDEWVNVDVKVSNGGKWYAAVNNWKPNGNGTPRNNAPQPTRRQPEPQAFGPDNFQDQDIPFISARGIY